jgi:hypothetical protein
MMIIASSYSQNRRQGEMRYKAPTFSVQVDEDTAREFRKWLKKDHATANATLKALIINYCDSRKTRKDARAVRDAKTADEDTGPEPQTRPIHERDPKVEALLERLNRHR